MALSHIDALERFGVDRLDPRSLARTGD